MSDIVVTQTRRVNILDKIIQNVVIMVNMNKMSRAIDEHLLVIRGAESEDQKAYQENILREIVYVKYQYDIMQRKMYELRLSYSDDIISKINSTDKTERLELQKDFLEMEYDRITKNKFRNKEDIKYMLLIVSSVIQAVKQDIKDEGKRRNYNKIIKCAEAIDTKIIQGKYEEECYTELFEDLKDYVNYINNNYDIAKLPVDEKDIIELVIEATINGLESDIDRLHYEFDLIINICKNAYRYFKIIDKVFEKIQIFYDDALLKENINLQDYINFYTELYDAKIKTEVNDVHRTIRVEDEYLEYSKVLHEEEGLHEYMLRHALETTLSEDVKSMLSSKIDEIEEARKLKEKEEEEKDKPPKCVEVIEEVYELIGGQPEMTEAENV